MNQKTIQKILENEETLDLLKAAEASLELEKRNSRKKHVPDTRRSLVAWERFKSRKIEEEKFRQRLKEVWNKHYG
jgi:hypothetical protein